MRKKVQILSVTKNQIIYKISNKRPKVLVPLCISFIVGFLLVFSLGSGDIQQVSGSMSYIYNPVNSLYSDNGAILFTSGYLIEKESLNFAIPVISSKIEVETDGTISFLIDKTIMIKSSEIGVVEDLGSTVDGVKYIKIRHSIDVYSIIENVDIIGVEENSTVKKGQDIATAKLGELVKFKLFYQDGQVRDLKVNQSKIVWER